MSSMTSKERIGRILSRQAVDRIGLAEAFWDKTSQKWQSDGHLNPEEEIADHFELDMRNIGPFDRVVDLDFSEEIIAEDDQTQLVRDGNGAVLRWLKNKSGTPEHVDFLVKDRGGWNEHARGHLTNESNYRRRINFSVYHDLKEHCRQRDLWFNWSGRSVFECMHPLCGHEYMLMGMALDPDWVRDMCEVYSDLCIHLMEILFAEEGKPDGLWFYEDMGFKNKPFMSPQMYKQIVWPAHKKTFDFAHSLGLAVTVHSCGFVEPLVPGLIEAGMDCLQAMESKAGMDLVRLKRAYGDQIAFCGGMDVRALESNDCSTVQAELDRKLLAAAEGGGYILHSDHSIPPSVEYETYRYFAHKGLEMGTGEGC